MDLGNIGKLTFKLALWEQILTEKYLFSCINYKGLYGNWTYRISRSISRVFETQNSSQKIDLDLYPGHKKYCPGVDYFFYFHMFTIFVLSGSVAKLSSSAISGKTKNIFVSYQQN